MTIPNSPEAERGVLACIFIDGQTGLAKALEFNVDEHHFHDPVYQRIWKGFLWLHRHNKPITIDVLVEELRGINKLDEIGIDRLLDVSGHSPTTLEFKYWLQKLREMYVFRRMYHTALEVSENAQALKGSPEDFVAKVHSILHISASTRPQKTLWEAAQDILSKCKRIDNGETIQEDRGMTWPWRDWSDRLGTCKQTELVILAARPSRGKSSAGRQIAMHWAQTYGDTIYFSREMSVEEITPLFAQTMCRKSWKQYPSLFQNEKDDFKTAVRKVESTKTLHLYETDRTVNQLIARVRSFGATNKLKGIVIDYLQRYDPQQEKGETRDIALGRLTGALKDLALEMKIPVILLAQLGRSVERETREPRLSDLRESGNIEQDADRVIFIDWPTTKPDGSTQDINDGTIHHIYVNAIQAKGRGEGCDRVPMMFNRPIASFESISH